MTISVVHVTQLTELSGTIAETTSGNCLAVCIMGYSSNSSAPSITGIELGGSADNFSQAAYNNTQIYTSAFIWVNPDCNGGQTALAISADNITNSTVDGITVFEIAGLAASSVTDKTNNGDGSSSTSWSSGATGTLSQAAEIVIGCVDIYTTPITPGSPWTEYTTDGAGSGYQIVNATTSVTYSGTQSPAGPWGAAIASLLGQTATNANVTGVTGTIAVTAPAGMPGVTLPGVTGAITVAAPAGAVTLTGSYLVSGVPGQITVSAPRGAPAVGPATPSPGQITVTAPAGNLMCHLSAVSFTPALLYIPQTGRRTTTLRKTARRGIPRSGGRSQHLERLGIPQPNPAITWNVRRPVTTSSPAITWNNRKTVAATTYVQWDTRARVTGPQLHLILHGTEKHAAAGIPRRRRRTAMPGGVSRQSRLQLPLHDPIRWNTLGGVSKIASAAWNATTRISAGAYTQWGSTDGGVTASCAIGWNTDCQIVNVPFYPDFLQDESGSPLLDESGGFILDEAPASNVTWNTRQLVTSTAAISWTTYGHKARTRHVLWNTLIAVVSPPAASLAWESLHQVSAGPQATVSHAYPSVRHATGKKAARARRRLPVTGASAQHTTHLLLAPTQPGVTWSTLTRVTATALAAWNVSQRLSPPPARTGWNTIARLPITRHRLVVTRGRAALRRRHRRGLPPSGGSVQQTARLQIPQASGLTAQAQWNVRHAVTSGNASLAWNDLKHVVASSATIAWNTGFRLHQQATADWAAIQRTSVTAQLEWDITPTVSKLRLPKVIPQAVRHTVARQSRPRRGLLRSGGYSQHTDRIAVPQIPSPIAWNVLARVTVPSAAIEWAVISRLSASPALTTWAVIAIIDPGVTAQWEIRGAVAVTSPSVQWNIGQPLQGDMRLASMDEWFTPE